MQIFSLLMQLFMGHIMSGLHLLKKRIFVFMCKLKFLILFLFFVLFCFVLFCFFFFKLGLCVFNFPLLLNFTQNCFPQNCFSQNLFCFSYFYRGRNLFFPKVASLILYFLLSFVVYVFLFILWLGCLCQYVTKRGRNRWNLEKVFKMFCLGGVEIVFEREII